MSPEIEHAVHRYATWLTRRRAIPFTIARAMAELAFAVTPRRA